MIKNNPTFNANKTDKTVQDYKENGNEVELASYTLKAEEGQRFTASGERQFDGYKLYQAADANDQSGTVSRPSPLVRNSWMRIVTVSNVSKKLLEKMVQSLFVFTARSKTTKQTF